MTAAEYLAKLERNGCAVAPNGCTYKLVQDRPEDYYSVWVTSAHDNATCGSDRRQIVSGYHGTEFESLGAALRWAYTDGCLEYQPGVEFTERVQIA